MEQFNSGELNFIFEINSHKYSIGLMSVGNFVLQQEEIQIKDISIALIIGEQSFTSVLPRDTLDIVSLILCYKTMLSFRVEYFITSTTLDVRSIFTLLQTMD